MKIQTIIAAGLMIILSSTVATTFAQSPIEPSVKILPTTEKGILKLLYAYDAHQSVNVSIFNDDERLLSDEIKEGTFQKGFTKKYDVRNIASKNFWIEVKTDNISVTYRLTRSKDGKTYEPFLEKTAYNHTLVASNN